jgi:hypothetical protein
MRLVKVIVGFGLVLALFACSSKQGQQSGSWIDSVKGVRSEALSINSNIVLDRIMVTPEEIYVEKENVLKTTVFLVNKEDLSLFESSFSQGSQAQPVRNSGTSSVSNKDADALFNLVKLPPDEALAKANEQLPTYQSKHPEEISFFLELFSGNAVPENLRGSAKVVWKVRYSARDTQTAFNVWVDAQNGSILQTDTEELK